MLLIIHSSNSIINQYLSDVFEFSKKELLTIEAEQVLLAFRQKKESGDSFFRCYLCPAMQINVMQS
jgi:hypothetical protein